MVGIDSLLERYDEVHTLSIEEPIEQFDWMLDRTNQIIFNMCIADDRQDMNQSRIFAIIRWPIRNIGWSLSHGIKNAPA